MWGSRDRILDFWPPIEAGYFKFLTETDGSNGINEKMQYLAKRGHMGSSDPFFKFLGASNISRTLKAGYFEFGIEKDGNE